jgi:hypothetical protein
VVIFNPMAESPTFIIAICGVGIWYFTQQRNPLFLALLIVVFVFTCVSPTDIFPRSIRNALVRPYALKGVPCILTWLIIQYQLIFYRSPETSNEQTSSA